MNKEPLFFTALLLWGAAIPATAAGEDTPSIELLEYLADHVEDEKGRLLDPVEQMDEDDVEPESYSHQEYMREQTDR